MLKQLRSYFKTIWTVFNKYALWVPLAAAVVLVGCLTWYELNLRPIDKAHSQTFRITQGEGATAISKRLYEQGFIRNAYAFEIYITLHGQRRRLQSGIYSPPAHSSAKQIANMIAKGQVDAKRLTVPEGSNITKIKELAAAQGIKATDFDAAMAAYRAGGASPALRDIPGSISLEGYLFPDTYTISGDDPAKDLVSSMVANLEDSVKELDSGFKKQGFTLHQALTLASVVEKEVAGYEDQRVVAGIFMNRLRSGQGLESDVTVIYAVQLANQPFNLDINSPYNTYRNTGLPIGPICNPGLSALRAVADPAQTDYVYFLAGKDGKTYYAKTFAEHEQNIAKYM